MTHKWRIVIAASALMGLSLGAAYPDILILTNNKKMMGIIKERADDARSVTMLGAYGEVTIPRTRIKSIERESVSQGYVHIGDEFTRLDRLDDSLAAYREALAQDPDNTSAADRIRTTQEALNLRHETQRRDDIEQIDRIKADIRGQIRRGNFIKSEKMLQDVSELVPTKDQKTVLRDIVGELYLEWGKERLDKYDLVGASEKLNLAYAAQPDREEVVTLLLRIWEGQEDKKPQMLRIFKTILERRPDDQSMRRRVADLNYELENYEDSLENYLTLYRASDLYKGSNMEARLLDNLEVLHHRYAKGKNYDQAILVYKLLATIDPDADTAPLIYYEYLKRAEGVKADDLIARLQLAQYCEQEGLRTLALQHYRAILSQEEGNEAARGALDRFALELITEASAKFNEGQFLIAKEFARRAQRDFPEAKEAELEAAKIIAMADNEIISDRRQKREQAKDFIRAGDNYYAQAQVHYQRIFDTTITGAARLSTPKADAKRHFRFAIDAYEKAIEIDPALQRDDASLVMPRLNESRAILQRLEAGPPRRRGIRFITRERE